MDQQVSPAQHAHFAAAKRRIFGEMAQSAARWRLTWFLPYNAFVVVLLATNGMAPWRVAVLVTALCISTAMFFLQIVRSDYRFKNASMFIGATLIFCTVAVTGGLASPLLVTSLPLLMGAAITLSEPRWVKRAFFFYFIGGHLVIALLSRTALGELDSPLTAEGRWATVQFVTLTMMSVAFITVASYQIGCSIAQAYQRIALELAERREELCSENVDRTRALEGIAARLAHEVKNPLAAIKGLSTHMARSSSDPKAAERLSIVAAEADRLQGIVDGFLSFSRGLDDLVVAPTRPGEIAREIATLLETRASDHGVTLEVAGGQDIIVNADGRKLRQALLNLVLNAMQASPPGKPVKIDVARRCVEGVRIRVTDEGAGMTPEVLERIRKPYFTTKEGGTGLGVAVARGLVEQHGGQLNFESAPGKGTTVSIDLPMCSRKFMKEAALPNPLRATTEVPAEAPAR
jgi:signal transduction histidine kinase